MKLTISHVEVRIDGGGWLISIHYKEAQSPRIMGRYRLKRNAKLIARGIAMALGTELRITNRRGQYTKEAASFGNDPRDIEG